MGRQESGPLHYTFHVRQKNDFLWAPNVIGKASLIGWRDPPCLVNPAKVTIQKMNRNPIWQRFGAVDASVI
jgi:hypothetical protein